MCSSLTALAIAIIFIAHVEHCETTEELPTSEQFIQKHDFNKNTAARIEPADGLKNKVTLKSSKFLHARLVSRVM